ncbi:MAG TPA: ubiquinol-cytochrome c reductase iron-sulfur subunit [Nostocaceae cyanobacterium]|nr:ubiquinol-cytochrome c reductase iron-sulfur subunit [Nostocaceae cyanobacterium]
MKRREFINWVGLGWLAASLPVAIAACTSDKNATASSATDSSQTTTTASSGEVAAATKRWQKVGTAADLDKTGQLFAENSPVGPVLVVGTSKKPKNLFAVNPTCTHKGCTVAWEGKKNQFVCPCHDAEFGKDGKVVEGPAKKPLKTYAVKIERGSVLVLA